MKRRRGSVVALQLGDQRSLPDNLKLVIKNLLAAFGAVVLGRNSFKLSTPPAAACVTATVCPTLAGHCELLSGERGSQDRRGGSV